MVVVVCCCHHYLTIVCRLLLLPASSLSWDHWALLLQLPSSWWRRQWQWRWRWWWVLSLPHRCCSPFAVATLAIQTSRDRPWPLHVAYSSRGTRGGATERLEMVKKAVRGGRGRKQHTNVSWLSILPYIVPRHPGWVTVAGEWEVASQEG